MLQRKRQAVCKQQIALKRQKRQKFILHCSYVILAISLLLWLISFLKHTQLFKINHISIEGQYTKINTKKVAKIMLPYLHTNLLTLDSYKLQQQLLTLPWVDSVKVHRHWPHELQIALSEKKAIALWYNHGLISQSGELFFPSKNTFPANLPEIDAPKDLIENSLSSLTTMDLALSTDNLSIAKLMVKQRDDISLVLKNGIKVLLGRDNQMERLQRFIDIFYKVFENRLNQVQYVDMRYTNGMAVKWRSQTEN